MLESDGERRRALVHGHFKHCSIVYRKLTCSYRKLASASFLCYQTARILDLSQIQNAWRLNGARNQRLWLTQSSFCGGLCPPDLYSRRRL